MSEALRGIRSYRGDWKRFVCRLLGRHSWECLQPGSRLPLRPVAPSGMRAPPGCLSRCRRCHEVVNDLPRLSRRTVREILDGARERIDALKRG